MPRRATWLAVSLGAVVVVWGDPEFGGKATVGKDWVYPGQAGWYIGHLLPGGEARFDDLRWKPLGVASGG